MPEFAYIARDPTGKRIEGQLSAATRHEALSVLGQRSLFPLQVAARVAPRGRFFRGRVKPQAVATAYGQLADLLKSGVALPRSLDVLRKQSSNSRLAEVLEDLKSRVEEGSSLADAMQRHPAVFGEMPVSMVRAGSEGGFLEEALVRVAQFTEQQQDLKGRVVGALAYPAFLSAMGTIVVSVLIIFFVPMFAELFSQLRERGELPIATEILLGASDFLRAWWPAIFGGLAIGAYLAWERLSTDAGRTWRDLVKIKLPVAGAIFLNLAVARFCRVLGTLLHNGVPILRSLSISSDAAGNRVLAQAVRDAGENISSGEALAGPLAACGHFPPAVVEMIAVAEEANSLETVLVHIADGLERRTWRQLDLMVRLLEPIMLMLLAGVVLFVVLALLLPVIKMSTTVN